MPLDMRSSNIDTEFMVNTIQTYRKGSEILEIFCEEYTQDFDPRENDNLGTMVCSHRNYNLGDVQIQDSLEQYLKEECIFSEDIAIMLPLWLYDHGGLAMRCGSFHEDQQGFDSGRVGVIYITKKKIREEYNVKRISKARILQITKYLQNEVKTYDDYLQGNVYGYSHSRLSSCDHDEEHKDIIDSCGGFIGDISTCGILDEFDLSQWTREL